MSQEREFCEMAFSKIQLDLIENVIFNCRVAAPVASAIMDQLKHQFIDGRMIDGYQRRDV